MTIHREEFAYVACLDEGTGIERPDFPAVVDVNPESDTYSQIIPVLGFRATSCSRDR